jgi:hypothetical protein
MSASIALAALALPALLAAQSWKQTPIVDWTPDEAKQVLTDSPWAKAVTPTIDKAAVAPHTTANPGGVDIGGVGIGFPGMGRRGMNGRTTRTPGENPSDSAEVPKLTLRWASALPVSAAQVIVHELNAPAINEDQYAVSIYGLPARLLAGSTDRIAAELKRSAILKREGKKDIKPSAVDILMREDGAVVVYSFPRSAEIVRDDAQVDFEAQIGRLKITQPFVPAEMLYQGKMQL